MLRFIALAALLALANVAPAQVLDFEDVPPSAGTIPSVTTKGFTLTCLRYFYVSSGPDYCQPECPGGSGHYIIAQGTLPSGPLTLQQENGDAFSLVAFDYGETNIGSGYPAQIRVDGQRVGGDSVSFTVTLDGINDGSGPLEDFQHASPPSAFTNLRSVTFSGMSGGSLDRFNYSLDNIQVSTQVGPTSVPNLGHTSRALLVLLLAGVGAWLAAQGSL